MPTRLFDASPLRCASRGILLHATCRQDNLSLSLEDILLDKYTTRIVLTGLGFIGDLLIRIRAIIAMELLMITKTVT